MPASRFFQPYVYAPRAHSGHSALIGNSDHDFSSGRHRARKRRLAFPPTMRTARRKARSSPAYPHKRSALGSGRAIPVPDSRLRTGVARIPVVLHQQPCYCYCERRTGHNSLHSCFEGTHGARCAACLKELYYSYQQAQSRARLRLRFAPALSRGIGSDRSGNSRGDQLAARVPGVYRKYTLRFCSRECFTDGSR